ncbi:YhcN/YlaJ family sporulation lipoprotein [Bacillus sp. S/N-304-OC-R1]|uniref:YhcN/YlaJ family sporulation lipoprotein n=1 Tax=Bacillus sp. S/N-304-OC-R1 TaxID=2758034 RepID=UPI001C8E803B|nr:YhcN/YlaJ family sporulation lipoprotein [Bacillus sp. S/N-304-OC-R1]MBY0120377.1 YhcN/YlaJ family sporulation lipoprotein [Bacillus sp. S/N-304-OC-R1]
MKIKAIIAGLFTMSLLAGCGVNNKNLEDTAMGNRDNNGLTRVNNPGVNTNPVYDNRNMRGTDLTPVGDNNYRDDNYRNDNMLNNNSRNDSHNMRVADRAADRITSLKEVDSAYVIVVGNNAYVAAKLANNRKDISRDIEGKISDQVKKEDKDINDVYVSVNPDFYDRMTGYSNDIRSGKPVGGFFDEFTNTVRRVFPTHFNK